jgi:hypothetical protein
VRIGVIFTTIMVVLGIGPFRSQHFKPLFEIQVQAGFIVIYENTGGDMHCIAQKQALLDPAFLQTFANLRSNVHKIPSLADLIPKFLSEVLHDAASCCFKSINIFLEKE